MATAGPTLLANALQENSRVYSFERCPAAQVQGRYFH